jgi:OPT family oligopeptide transporter
MTIAPSEQPVDPRDPERRWLEDVYKGGIKQLTARAVVSGMLIGMVMCLSNLYVVLKTGWSMGVTVTACILAWSVFRVLGAVRLVKGDFTILENNAMSSVASAAGYMTGGGNMAAVPALLMLTGTRPDPWSMFFWFAVIAALGVFAAIPIKRQLINIEGLSFPTGTATAETLRALHGGAHDDGGGAKKARLLFGSSLVGVVVAWARDAKTSWMPFNLPAHFAFPFDIAGHPAAKWTMGAEGSLLLVGAGGLMSFRTGWSVLLGAIFTYGFLGPYLFAEGVIKEIAYRKIVEGTVWMGAAILVSSGILSFAFQWRSVAKSFEELARIVRPKKEGTDEDPLASVECPPWWFPAGFAVFGPIIVVLMWILFDIPVWAGVIALPLSIIMGVVASRVTGETDVTPTKALGPVTQLIFGGLLPGNLTANIMSANVTGGVGLHAADLLTDLKSGYLLGANPRQQFYAQLFGVLAGAAIVVPAFNVLVPDAQILGSEVFPAPGAQVWAGVSKVLSAGAGALHPIARTTAIIGAVLGSGLAIAERFAPKSAVRFIPSPAGLGVAFVVPGYNAVSIFIGAALSEILRRKQGAKSEETIFPVASGFIAGESLMGILIAMLVAFGVMTR